jgi:hypothetical protein
VCGADNEGLHRRGYAVLHPCAPAGIVLVIGIVAYAFIFILGRLEAVADPPATVMCRRQFEPRAAKENVRPAAAPVTLDTIVVRREERACRQEPR